LSYQKQLEQLEKVIKQVPCPKCGSSLLFIWWSPCKDPYCCGIDDRIQCDGCDDLDIEHSSIDGMDEEELIDFIKDES